MPCRSAFMAAALAHASKRPPGLLEGIACCRAALQEAAHPAMLPPYHAAMPAGLNAQCGRLAPLRPARLHPPPAALRQRASKGSSQHATNGSTAGWFCAANADAGRLPVAHLHHQAALAQRLHLRPRHLTPPARLQHQRRCAVLLQQLAQAAAQQPRAHAALYERRRRHPALQVRACHACMHGKQHPAGSSRPSAHAQRQHGDSAAAVQARAAPSQPPPHLQSRRRGGATPAG